MVGYALGTFVTIKYMVPPTTEISIGKIKLKGNDNTVSDILDVTDATEQPTRREARKARKDIRAADRAIKKEARKRNRDGG